MRISVVGTVHEDTGPADASALFSILSRIAPEVVFLEMPPETLGDYSNGVRWNLESTAVNRYRELHQVDLVAVDLPTPEAVFFRNIDELHRAIKRRSPDYYRLVSWDNQYIERHGFAYLNSEYCAALVSDMHAARLAALDKMADQRLSEIYEQWTRTNELRDHAMLKNIESYCIGTSCRKGAFLVGAAHRQSIHDKSTEYGGSESHPIQWAFDGFL